MTTIDEAETAERFRRALDGDREAYRRFLHDVTPVVRGIVRARLGTRGRDDVEDVVQETLLALHAKRHTWRRDRPVLPWLYAIARHKTVDRLRGERRVGTEVGLEHAEAHAADDAVEAEEEAMDVERAVSLLEGRSRQVVRAIGIEGVSVAETGKKLGMSENAVRVAFHRGLTRLVALRSTLLGGPSVPGEGGER